MAKPSPLPRADMVFGRAVLGLKLVSMENMEACADEVRRLAKAGSPKSLAEVVVERGFLTPEQYRQVARETSQLPREDMVFGRTVLGLKLVSMQDMEACAEEVRRLAKAGTPKSLADVTLEKSFLTPEQHRQVLDEVQRRLAEQSSAGAAPAAAAGAAAAAPPPEALDPKAQLAALQNDANRDPRDLAIRKALRVNALAETFTLGPYTQLRFLGAGSIGVVYRGLDAGGKPVAVKAFASTAKGDEKLLRRFLRERRVVRTLEHPGIVRVLDVGMHAEVPYFAMELLEGRPLDEVLRAERPPRGTLLALVVQLADAVAYAHERGVVHRELKPSCIFVRAADGTPVITDFGLAKDASDEFKLTMAGGGGASWLGSPVYTAPEVQNDPVSAGVQADVFTLGVLLYDACCARLPWEGKTEVDLITKMMTEDPLPPSRVDSTVPATVDKVCLRALARDPTKRQGSAREFARDLEAANLKPNPKALGFLARVTRRLFGR